MQLTHQKALYSHLPLFRPLILLCRVGFPVPRNGKQKSLGSWPLSHNCRKITVLLCESTFFVAARIDCARMDATHIEALDPDTLLKVVRTQ
jgi:hypothetical protein